MDEAVPGLEGFLSSKAIKGVFDSTVVQKTEDIKKILIGQQCEISLKTRKGLILQCYLENDYSLGNYYFPYILCLGGELQL